jgi:hypothetical protein
MKTYEAAGWIDGKIGEPINLTTLVTQLEIVAQQSDVPVQIANLLRTSCVLALEDLLATAPGLCDAPYVRTLPTLEPTIIEFGWLGSDINTTLLRGCLWAWFALALTSSSMQPASGLVALTDAHALLGSAADKVRSSASAPSSATYVSPLPTFVQNIARAGVGTIIIDDRPDLLSTEVAHKAAMTMLTSNATTVAQEHVAMMIGASPRQRMRMRRLNPMEAVVAMRGLTPMLIKL